MKQIKDGISKDKYYIICTRLPNSASCIQADAYLIIRGMKENIFFKKFLREQIICYCLNNGKYYGNLWGREGSALDFYKFSGVS